MPQQLPNGDRLWGDRRVSPCWVGTPPPLTGRGPVPGMTTPSQRQRLARPLVGLCLQEL